MALLRLLNANIIAVILIVPQGEGKSFASIVRGQQVVTGRRGAAPRGTISTCILFNYHLSTV